MSPTNPHLRGTVVVCEGGFDALAVERAAEDVAVAVLGGGGGAARSQNVLTAAVRKLARFEEVLLAHDGDDAGDRMAAELNAAIPRARRVRPPGGVDCAKMTERELRGIIRA